MLVRAGRSLRISSFGRFEPFVRQRLVTEPSCALYHLIGTRLANLVQLRRKRTNIDSLSRYINTHWFSAVTANVSSAKGLSCSKSKRYRCCCFGVRNALCFLLTIFEQTPPGVQSFRIEHGEIDAITCYRRFPKRSALVFISERIEHRFRRCEFS